MNNKERGGIGEDLASIYLRKQGYRIIEQNFRCKLGEIDIVAWDKKTLVFIEVKTRTSLLYGFPQEAVGWKKQRRLVRLADFYLMRHNLRKVECRFDVVAVTVGKAGNRIEIIKNAFSR